MAPHDEPIPRKNKGKKQPKKRNSEQSKLGPSWNGRTCGIDRLNLDEAANYL